MRVESFLLSLVLLPHAAAEDSATVTMARLISNYGSIAIRPKLTFPGATERNSPPEVVEVQFYVAQMRPLDMVAQTYGFDGYMRSWWHDPRLAYNSTAEGGYFDNLNLGPTEIDRIWKPTFYWEGAREITLSDEGLGTGTLLWVSPDGSVWWSRQTSFVMSCPFANGKNLDKLPFDTQTCSFVMGMYSQKASEVYIQWRTTDDNPPVEKVAFANWQGACLAEWHATKLEQLSELQVYVGANYTYARAEIDFTRAPAVWLLSYLMPTVLAAMLSYTGFFIDPVATPARVALGMLSVLVVMTNFVSLADKLPPTVGLPWLARFLLYSFFFNVFAMIEQVMVSFGNNIQRWLDAQFKNLALHTGWRLGHQACWARTQELDVADELGTCWLSCPLLASLLTHQSRVRFP